MFKKYFLISILLCIPSLSYAQSFPRPPYDGRFDDAIIESLRNKIDNDRIGKNNGVAGLDNNGNLAINIANSKIFTGKINLNLFDKVISRNYKATFFDNLNDGSTSPDSIIFGGHQTNDSVFMKIIGGTYSHGDNGGVILSVLDTGTSTFGSRNGAGLDDSIVIFPKTQDQSPRISVGQDITDSVDGITHTVSYGVNSVTITPALPTTEITLIKPRMRLYSNYKNGNSTNGSLVKHHNFIWPQLYYAYVNTVTTTATSTTINVFSDADNATPGWFINGATAKAAPGENAGDTIDNTSDTASNSPGIIFSYAHPALFIGMSNKKFILNPMLQFTGAKNSVTRAGVGAEYDQMLPSNLQDYQYQISGESFNPNTHGHRLTDDSLDMYLGGTGIPTMLQISGGAEATEIRGSNFYAGTKGFGTIDTSTSPQLQGFTHLMGRFAQYTGVNSSNASTSGHQHILSIYQQRMSDNTDGTHINPSDVSINILEAFDGDQPDAYGNGGTGGTPLAKIRLWQNNIYLCGTGQGNVTQTSVDSISCSMMVNSSGITANQHITINSGEDINGNLFIYSGNSLYMCVGTSGSTCYNFYPSQNGINLSGQFSADSYGGINSTGNINTGSGKALVLKDVSGGSSTYLTGDSNGNLHLSGGLILPQGTPSSNTDTCTKGQIEMDASYVYSCIETNTWVRNSVGTTW